jgi:hypothetical protein
MPEEDFRDAVLMAAHRWVTKESLE